MKKNIIFWLITSAVLLIPLSGQAQTTVGSDIQPTRAALLELKNRQTTGTVPSVSDTANITSTMGGLLLPRVKLVDIHTLEPFIPSNDIEFVNNTNSLKEKLAGLMVYNITDNGPASDLQPAVYTWDGAAWTTSQINEALSSITAQPKAFTFYELGTETPEPLAFAVDGLGTWTYQWYQVTGSNVHVRIGTPIGQSGTISGAGATTASFTPTGVIKGTTRNANYAGFYKFYCIATSSLGVELTSDIAEVAVGCGAKNNEGEWISFMCFNLGALISSTIQSQKDYPIGSFTNADNGIHTYIPGEEDLWGDLFQWGRIADGHEKRQSGVAARGAMTVDNVVLGNRCSTQEPFNPYYQIKKGTAWYGNFITTTAAVNYNWNPIDQATADLLWRSSRFLSNDPCARYRTDGTYHEFWHEGTQNTADSPACGDVGTAWRAPTNEEWGVIYKNSTISGGPATATANTWVWYGGTNTPVSSSRGYEIKPDGETTTLFLPATGNRQPGNASLAFQGTNGYYWSVSITGVLAHYLSISASNIIPANSIYRSYGYALRCIKNS